MHGLMEGNNAYVAFAYFPVCLSAFSSMFVLLLIACWVAYIYAMHDILKLEFACNGGVLCL